MVHSLDTRTDFFDIVAGVFQRDTFAAYMFIISLDYVLRMSIDSIKETSFPLKKRNKK